METLVSGSNIIASSPFRGLNVVQILDVQHHLLGLLLGCLSLLLRQLQVSSNHILQRFDIDLKAMTNMINSDSHIQQGPGLCKHLIFLLTHLLTDVLVLVETFLGQVALAEIHAELQVLEHDGLVDLLPCSMFLALDDIVQNIQSWLLLANLKKLCTSIPKNRLT